MERTLVELIAQDKIKARIDSANKVLEYPLCSCFDDMTFDRWCMGVKHLLATRLSNRFMSFLCDI